MDPGSTDNRTIAESCSKIVRNNLTVDDSNKTKVDGIADSDIQTRDARDGQHKPMFEKFPRTPKYKTNFIPLRSLVQN